MVDAKTVIVTVVTLFSVFVQSGVRAQSTIDTSAKDDSCPHLEEALEFQVTENMRLQSELKTDRQTIKNLECERRQQRPLTATFRGNFDSVEYQYGIAKVKDKIYILNNNYPNKIKVYEDLSGFRFVRDIALSGTQWNHDIVYSTESECVYISDYENKCIWVMRTTGENRVTKWLTGLSGDQSYTLSLTTQGHLLVLRTGASFPQDNLEIYSLNAKLLRTLQLPPDFKKTRHALQTMDGNFIILHKLNNATSGLWVISQLKNDGQLIHRFIPSNQSEKLFEPAHLSLDSVNNRLFVADFYNNRVIIFDSRCLTWSQVLFFEEMNGIFSPFRLLYDESKKHLFIGQYYPNVTAVYEIN